MVHRHYDDILMLSESGAVVADRAACSLIETAAMEPHHHGPLARAVSGGRPNVQVETVLAEIAAVGWAEDIEELHLLLAARPVGLRSVVAERESIAHARPRR